MSEKLLNLLRQHHVERLIADAELIRDWPDSAERIDAARRHIRQAMYLRTLGKGDHQRPQINVHTSITEEELQQIFGILDFAVEPAEELQADRWQDLAG
ncbi:hypothetical protein [Symmachiella dynata]|uniref:hypothetical protein n=1 Tax=Symmachiella dynata TaxID=2527995 RepID=UPI0011A879ED|nr:hypothetical protein [Symmachiella dynata]